MENIKQSIGVYLDLTDLTCNHPEEAENKVDVRVKLNNEIKDFTFEEFREILGF